MADCDHRAASWVVTCSVDEAASAPAARTATPESRPSWLSLSVKPWYGRNGDTFSPTCHPNFDSSSAYPSMTWEIVPGGCCGRTVSMFRMSRRSEEHTSELQ